MLLLSHMFPHHKLLQLSIRLLLLLNFSYWFLSVTSGCQNHFWVLILFSRIRKCLPYLRKLSSLYLSKSLIKKIIYIEREEQRQRENKSRPWGECTTKNQSHLSIWLQSINNKWIHLIVLNSRPSKILWENMTNAVLNFQYTKCIFLLSPVICNIPFIHNTELEWDNQIPELMEFMFCNIVSEQWNSPLVIRW